MNVVPFPRIRHQSFVQKHAQALVMMSAPAAARYLQRQLKVQSDTMERRGIDPAVIAREMAALERAILSEAACWEPCKAGDSA
jgi:hypothetical protein